MTESQAEEKLNFRIGDNSKQELIVLVERIERLTEEIDAIGDDRTEVYAEAKAAGFDTKVLRKVLALRKLDPDKRKELLEVTDLYMTALGMV